MGGLIVSAALIGLSSVMLNDLYRYLVLYLSILLEFVLPLILKKRKHIDIHKAHLVERIGLLTIILLGESVFSLITTSSNLTWSLWTSLAMISGFVLLGSLWWILFDFFYLLEDSQRIKKPTVLIIPTLFMHMGLAMIANIIRHALLNDLVAYDFSLLTLVGISVFFFGKQIPYLYVAPKIRKNVIQNTVVVFLFSSISILLPHSQAVLLAVTLTVLIYVALTFRYMIHLKVATQHILNKQNKALH